MGDIQNKAQKFGGQAKEAFGDATNDKELRREGQADQASAGAKEKLQGAADAVGDKIDDLRK